MGQTLGAFLVVCAALGAVAQGLAALAGIRRAADAFTDDWREDYDLRLCAQLAAAEANLDDAAAYLALHHPELRARLERSAAELAAALRAGYPAAVVPDGAGAAATCRVPGHLALAASLHRERHTAQPARWPNWVARLQP